MIARRVLLLVSPFVLFIYNNKSQVGLRRKNGAPWPDDNVKFSFYDAAPFIKLFAWREPAMQYGDTVGKACRKALDGLGSQRDFRYQDNATFAPPYRLS